MTGSGIYHFAAQSKMASISEEFPGDCFDFDRLSASSLGGSVFKREQKEAVSRSREDFSILWIHFSTAMYFQKNC